jgi:REP element-mobilizing transposase RayT
VSSIYYFTLFFRQKKQGLEIHAWCVMSNHVHLVFWVSMVKTRITNCRFKRFTSQFCIETEKQKRFLLDFLEKKLKKLKCKALSILET